MSSTNSPNPVTPSPATGITLEKWMHARHAPLSLALLALAVLCAVLPIWQLILSFKKEPTNVPLMIWGAWLALVCLFGGMYLKIAEGMAETDSRYRLLALGLGGLVGLGTFLLGIALPLGPWSAYFVPAASDTTTAAKLPLLSLWRENWWRILLVALAVMGGLAAMFVSLSLARSVERTSAGMRRLLYGYNAVLTGLLLFAILGLLNVLAYVHLWPFTMFNNLIDWTPSQIYTLSPRSVNLLEKEVKGSVELIALMPARAPEAKDMEILYENIRRHKKDIAFQLIDPDAHRHEFFDAYKKYQKSFSGPEDLRSILGTGAIGVVVLLTDETGRQDSVGIRYKDLRRQQTVDPRDPEASATRGSYVFLGENQVMKALRKLNEKTPAKIYFTKGHGEMSLSEMDQQGDGLATFKSKLEKRGYYEFKEIELARDGVKGGSLADADVVIIARPRKPFSEEARKSLEEYVSPTGTSKKGKLIVLLDGQPSGGQIPKTGLEDLLKRQGVEVSNKRLLSATNRPDDVRVTVSDVDMPITRAFGGFGRIFLDFEQSRRIGPVAGATNLIVQPLLVTDPEFACWEESNMTASAVDLLNRYARQENRAEFRKMIQSEVPVAVAVSESQDRTGLPPGHAPVGQQVPRLVVFGSANWLGNELQSRGGDHGVDFLASSIQWLRGKGDLGEDIAEIKERPLYSLSKKGFDKGSKLSRLIWLPLGLAMIGIVALGGGIWLVRRR